MGHQQRGQHHPGDHVAAQRGGLVAGERAQPRKRARRHHESPTLALTAISGSRLVRAGGVYGATLVLYILAIRPRLLRWGPTEDEVQREAPGDQAVAEPYLVGARARSVWERRVRQDGKLESRNFKLGLVRRRRRPDPDLSEHAQWRGRAAARRSARNWRGDHRLSWQVRVVLAVRAPPRVHRCDGRTHRPRTQGEIGPGRPAALQWPADAPPRLPQDQPDGERSDPAQPERLLRHYQQQAVPGRSGPGSALATAALAGYSGASRR